MKAKTSAQKLCRDGSEAEKALSKQPAPPEVGALPEVGAAAAAVPKADQGPEAVAATGPRKRRLRIPKLKTSLTLPKRKRRLPAFDLTPAEVFALCKRAGRCQICAGQVLALRDLMQCFGWTILELSECSRVSRTMISAVLRVLKFPTSDITARLSACFGLELYEFDLLAKWAVEGEVPL